MERDFKWIWIPKEIWLATDLSIIEKVILVEIDSLDNKNWCFASNEYFAEFFWISVRQTSKYINRLIEKKFIKQIWFDWRKRILQSKLNNICNADRNKSSNQTRTKVPGRQEQKFQHNNIVNNKVNNKDIYSDSKDLKNSLKEKLNTYIKEIIPDNKQEQFKNILEEFINYRKEIKKSVTPIALKKNIKKLKEISWGSSQLAQKICDQTIEKGRATFYPLPEDYTEKNKKRKETKQIVETKVMENERYKNSQGSKFGRMLAGSINEDL